MSKNILSAVLLATSALLTPVQSFANIPPQAVDRILSRPTEAPHNTDESLIQQWNHEIFLLRNNEHASILDMIHTLHTLEKLLPHFSQSPRDQARTMHERMKADIRESGIAFLQSIA